jgi:nucleoside-diphosphate-sugar epimerase
MISAFMSDVFHALKAHEPFVAPVSPGATLWLMSVQRVADNFRHAIEHDRDAEEPFAVTLPAIRTTMADLAGEICRRTDADPALVTYRPQPAVEAGFGRQPPLETPRAEAMGFGSDGSLASLVGRALEQIREI